MGAKSSLRYSLHPTWLLIRYSSLRYSLHPTWLLTVTDYAPPSTSPAYSSIRTSVYHPGAV